MNFKHFQVKYWRWGRVEDSGRNVRENILAQFQELNYSMLSAHRVESCGEWNCFDPRKALEQKPSLGIQRSCYKFWQPKYFKTILFSKGKDGNIDTLSSIVNESIRSHAFGRLLIMLISNNLSSFAQTSNWPMVRPVTNESLALVL